MRKYGKIDANQSQIVDQLRQITGVTVRSTASIGDGFPDIILGFKARNYLFEIKDPSQPKASKELKPDQKVFFDTWTGQVEKVENLDGILKVINY